MHVYIYDGFLNSKKYDSILAKIETRITDLGLNGKIIRLGLLKNITGAVDNEIRRGAKTIIAVGNNKTLNEIANAVLRSDFTGAANTPLGIIPVGKTNNEIAGYLGIEPEENACDCLSARRIEKIDAGLAGKYYFIANASINNDFSKIEIDKNYSVETQKQGSIKIINFPFANDCLPNNAKFNPQDGKLELLVEARTGNKLLKNKGQGSVFGFKKLTVFNKKFPMTIDGCLEIKTPVDITISKTKIKLIVGKSRGF